MESTDQLIEEEKHKTAVSTKPKPQSLVRDNSYRSSDFKIVVIMHLFAI